MVLRVMITDSAVDIGPVHSCCVTCVDQMRGKQRDRFQSVSTSNHCFDSDLCLLNRTHMQHLEGALTAVHEFDRRKHVTDARRMARSHD